MFMLPCTVLTALHNSRPSPSRMTYRSPSSLWMLTTTIPSGKPSSTSWPAMSFLTWRVAMSDEECVDFGATQDDAGGMHALSTTLAWTLGQDPDQEGSNSCTA